MELRFESIKLSDLVTRSNKVFGHNLHSSLRCYDQTSNLQISIFLIRAPLGHIRKERERERVQGQTNGKMTSRKPEVPESKPGSDTIDKSPHEMHRSLPVGEKRNPRQ